MQEMLNFSGTEKQKVLEYLSRFEALEKKSEFEEARFRKEDCTITFYDSGKLLIQGNSAEKIKEKILSEIGIAKELFLGIDETGRGENYGPMVIAGVLGYSSDLMELRDSKKTSDIMQKKEKAMENSVASFVVSIPAQQIDEMRTSGKNLNQIEAEAIDSIVSNARRLQNSFRIVVDGNPLPVTAEGIEFLPKADDLNPVVGAASVIAKATREQSSDKQKRKTWKNA